MSDESNWPEKSLTNDDKSFQSFWKDQTTSW